MKIVPVQIPMLPEEQARQSRLRSSLAAEERREGNSRKGSMPDLSDLRSTAKTNDRGSEQPMKKTVSLRQSSHKRLALVCRRIIDSNPVVSVTTLLTLWVLICDDVRVLATEKPQDIAFEVILIISLIVFGLELLLTCVGKEDYFMGFFFILDVVSTASLALDLPSVQDSMASDEGGVGSASEGKTARIGAKAARVVRIVRLVRIVKLYKIIITHFEKRIDAWMGIKPGEDSSFLEERGEDQEGGPEKKKESRVGKQLSHATLKCVIVLILAMLVVVPSLSADDSLKYSVSPSYGADEIGETYSAKIRNLVPPLFYEQSLLRYIYYHNWFTGNNGCPPGKTGSCPSAYYNHVFWIGASGTNNSAVDAKAAGSRIHQQTVGWWEGNISQTDDLFNFGGMPAAPQLAMGSPWAANCDTTRSDGTRQFLKGFSLLDNSEVSYRVKCPSDLRPAEVDRYFPRLVDVNTAQQSHFVFYFDQRLFFREQAAFGIAVTTYVCFSLVVAIMFFSRDANRLVLSPIESMIAKVEKIRENPLAAVKMGDAEFRVEETERIKRDQRIKRAGGMGATWQRLQTVVSCCHKSKPNQPMETLILEKTLVKLGSLLALGFGEAGSNIINKNMQTGDSADVNVMIKGERVECIYGQAKIQDFSVITEVLQSKVMQFVNQIAEIVHGVVVEYNGAANKNTGDTFLLVWRSNNKDGSDLNRLANMSVAGFCKIIASLQQAPSLAGYRGHPKIQYLLGANYRVNLNIGLHAGWAFEGAMGSEYKIDASYISPNIAITANIEQATQHFQVLLLITEDVINKCSAGVTDVCRKIDTVMIAGHKDPMDLHSVDLDSRALLVDGPRKPLIWNPRSRYKVRQYLENERSTNFQDVNFAMRAIHNKDGKDDSVMQMRALYSVEFMETFKMGFKNYIEGEWRVAHDLLLTSMEILGRPDGPCDSLLDFMEQTKFEAPANWKGYRDLAPLLQGGPPRKTHRQKQQVKGATFAKDVYDPLERVPAGNLGQGSLIIVELPNAVSEEPQFVQPPEIEC